jgi:hypothetical protein
LNPSRGVKRNADRPNNLWVIHDRRLAGRKVDKYFVVSLQSSHGSL